MFSRSRKMARKRDEEREFIENIERLLAGEDVAVGKEMSEEYRTAFDFARKLTESRADPSPVFKQQLKDRLLLKLTEREVEARQKVRLGSIWEFLGNLVPRSPVWRTAAATLVIVLVTVGVLWRTGMFTQAPGLEELARGGEPEMPVVSPEAGLKAFEAEAEEAVEAMEVEEQEEGVLLAVAASKVIEVNQTRTVDGVAITLERVELFATESIVYAFNRPPDYTMPRDPESPPPSLQGLLASAQYSIDGGPVIDAGTSEINFLDNGMQHIFSIHETISEDAVELTFIITGLGELHGPWQFVISLQE
jgi:hypothetical protein